LVDPVAEEPEFGVTDTGEFYYLHLADLALQGAREYRNTSRKQEVQQRWMVQSRLHKSENLPLCHEDHVEMHVPQAGTWTEVPRYVCPKGGCSVSYNFRQGYSMLIRRRQYTRRNMTPRIRCPRGTTDVPFWG